MFSGSRYWSVYMKNGGKIILFGGLISAILLVLGAVYLMMSADTPEEIQARRKSQAIVSIFDSEDFSGAADGIERDALANSANPNNPINPATRKKYSDLAIKQFEELRQSFPENRMIPRRKTPVERENLLSKNGKIRSYIVSHRGDVRNGKATQEVIDKYFQYRTRYTRDKIELFQHVVDNIPDDLAPAKRERYERLLQHNLRKMEKIRRQREEAYRKSGIQGIPEPFI